MTPSINHSGRSRLVGTCSPPPHPILLSIALYSLNLSCLTIPLVSQFASRFLQQLTTTEILFSTHVPIIQSQIMQCLVTTMYIAFYIFDACRRLKKALKMIDKMLNEYSLVCEGTVKVVAYYFYANFGDPNTLIFPLFMTVS